MEISGIPERCKSSLFVWGKERKERTDRIVGKGFKVIEALKVAAFHLLHHSMKSKNFEF